MGQQLVVKSGVHALGGEKMLQLSPWGGKQIFGVVGSPLTVAGVCTLDLRFTDYVIQADFMVVDCLTVESIIGLDFLERQGCVVDLPPGQGSVSSFGACAGH